MPAHAKMISLARRLSLIVGLVNTLILAIATGACILFASDKIDEQLRERTDRSMDFLVQALQIPLWSMDTSGVQAIAKGMVIERGVGLMLISDSEDRVLFSHETDSPRFGTREKDIAHDGQVVGHLRFGLEDSLRSKAFLAIAGMGCGVGALILLAQHFFMRAILNALFRKPFTTIDDMIRAMANGTQLPPGDTLYAEFRPIAETFLDMHGTIRRQLGELRETASKYRAIFEHSPVGVFRATTEGRLLEGNTSLAHIFGYGRLEDLFASGPPDTASLCAAPQDRETILDALKSSPDGIALDVRMRRGDGSEFPATIIASLEKSEGTQPAFVNGIIEDITERREAQAALEESEAKFRDLFDSMPNGFYRSTPAGYVVDANPAFVNMLGYDSLEELRTVHIPTEMFVHETERKEVLADNPDFTSKIEYYRLKRKDGRIIRIEDNARYVKDPAGKTLFHEGICRDVTERWESQERIRQSEEKFSRLFRLSPDAIMLISLEDGRIIDVNEAFEHITGCSHADSVDRTIENIGLFTTSATLASIKKLLIKNGKVENFEFPLQRRDGSSVDCVASCQELELEDMKCVLAVFRDVTELKRMQQMMIQTEKMVSLGGIAAGVAHEINNPLGIILNTAQNLELRTRPDFPKNLKVAGEIGLDMALMDRYMQARSLHEFIRTIQDAALRAADIIRHMLNFSRCSESRRSVCSITDIVDKAIHLARSDFDLRKEYDFRVVEIVRDYEADLPPVECTETEIEQVFLNLLRNAAQAMAEIKHPLNEPRIVLRIRNTGSHLRIEVQDNGPGIPPETQRRVFEPFFTTKAPGVGTGLGLSVSYNIVTVSHKGRMILESEPGQGTRFTIDLPLPNTI